LAGCLHPPCDRHRQSAARHDPNGLCRRQSRRAHETRRPREFSSGRTRDGRRVVLARSGEGTGVEGMSRLLVCPPDYFSIDYEINPWMHRSNVVNPQIAVEQWHRLMKVLEHDVGVVLERMTPVPGLPDLVFTANAGVVAGRKAVPSRFRYP